jgi:hypothetical protein
VLRVVTTDSNVWVSQLSQDYANSVRRPLGMPEVGRMLNLSDSIASLLEAEDIRVLTGIRTLDGVYPLEPLPSCYEAELNLRSERAGIVRFGRFAQWQYVDLHELDWTRIL